MPGNTIRKLPIFYLKTSRRIKLEAVSAVLNDGGTDSVSQSTVRTQLSVSEHRMLRKLTEEVTGV